jgi:hypothetical protein
MKKERLRESILLALKRKYYYSFRGALKIIME